MHLTEFQTIYFDESLYTVVVRVNEKSQFATIESVMQAQYAILSAVETYMPRNLLMNLRDLRFAVTPELQIWVATEIVPKIIATGVVKLGYVMPTEFIESLAVEQIVDEVSEVVIQQEAEADIAYFDNEKDAFFWFTQAKNNLHQFA